MLHLALSALLALSGGTGDGADRDHDKNQQTATPEAVSAASSEDAIINDTYALGRSENLPIKVWIGYAYGTTDLHYDDQGDDVALPGIDEIRSQRLIGGVQFNPLNLAAFKLGLGAQATMANNTVVYNVDPTDFGLPAALPAINEEADSGFQLQNVKFFGVLRGQTLGIHGGYLLDMGDDDLYGITDYYGDVAGGQAPGTLKPPTSDRRDAVFFGADFDYPSRVFRLFGGVDYFRRLDDSNTPANQQDISHETVVFTAGAGVKISWVELGAAAILSSDIGFNRINEIYFADNPDAVNAEVDALGRPFKGGHHGSIAPYLRISPPAFPATLSIKGAVLDEYEDYGFAIGGANDLVTRMGFTAALTLGF